MKGVSNDRTSRRASPVSSLSVAERRSGGLAQQQQEHGFAGGEFWAWGLVYSHSGSTGYRDVDPSVAGFTDWRSEGKGGGAKNQSEGGDGREVCGDGARASSAICGLVKELASVRIHSAGS